MHKKLSITSADAVRIGIAVLLTAWLAGCGGGYRTRVMDTPETAGLKGHQKPYTVNGRLYRPMTSSEGFSQEGIASWYGSDFHGKKTSNGELYDMHGMTAAHKTLPMGTSVRVVNRQNGRESVVRINDRGPFVGERIIDLSYAAASQLGVVGPGTAPVRIEALGIARSDDLGNITYQPSPSYDVGSFAVQIGSFTVNDNARRLAEKYRQQLGQATIKQEWVAGRLFYRVWVGRYDSLSAAHAAKENFGRSGYGNCFVVALD
ncbi:MAG: septal ring lytic transglycosylase RlpA family protein [Syntrophotalea acetylenica]|jgi:rare lipoprotein A|uniref:septal ring lytic transglycosylase RlpA family protein n=1 Tax=Syntrophotalea TaxID=2812025 RepID=UPI002A369911|nr:septal ring lytic transglycosylase RlpA family protein [Syntrophotalea acetylenica]MDD4456111.1 septal ring lytic transglycosylase RlpA family protein [Syntrophotalea acetylenica]MDY0262816.1 septal ring lytic transglycosylase RlpA family protein [Syntrophotalea acetylenica]